MDFEKRDSELNEREKRMSKMEKKLNKVIEKLGLQSDKSSQGDQEAAISQRSGDISNEEAHDPQQQN